MSFENRILLNWINDISSVPKEGKRWPIIDVDERLVNDYKEYIDVASKWGFNGFTIWGLFISHSWPVPLEQCMSKERIKFINEIIDYAHKRDMKVLSGLGVYSWGFEELIRKYPNLKASDKKRIWSNESDNNEAMCFYKEEAREWMRKIIDFMLTTVDIDGFGMQAGDLGRCICGKCNVMGDGEYYSEVSYDTASYIKEKYPDKFLSVSGWGMSFANEADIPYFKKMSSKLDYIADVTESSNEATGYRKKLIDQLKCNFGTVGGVVVVPPHTWDRLRWWLPHLKINGSNIKDVARDGGKAMEYFTGVLSNPSDEVTLKAVGYMMNELECSYITAMEAAVDDTFKPINQKVCTDIAELMLRSEDAYFENMPLGRYGEFDFESLFAVNSEDATRYLADKSEEQLLSYMREIESISIDMENLLPYMNETVKANNSIIAMGNVKKDIEFSLKK